MTKLLLLALMPVLALAQAPVYRSDTRAVEVAVVAKDGNNAPVADLLKHDLRLFDNNVEQDILSFERLGRNPASPNSENRTTPRISVILLDCLNTEFGNQVYGRNAVSEMLRNLPQGEHNIAIFALGNSVRLLHAFSTDTASLRKSVDGYRGEHPAMGVGFSEPGGGRLAVGTRVMGPLTDVPVPFGYQRLEITLDAFSQIAKRMKNIPGEKSLLWVTGGFPPPDDHHVLARVAAALGAARVMLYAVDARGLLPCPGGGTCPWINANIAGMEEFAQQTGGKAFHDGNDLAAFARAALDDSREGYLLTYMPSNYKQDGSAHFLNLKTSRAGVNLRYRPGYVADPKR